MHFFSGNKIVKHYYKIFKLKKGSVSLCVCVLSCVLLFGTPWTVACQARLSMEFSRQEYWSGLPFPSPRDLPDQGLNPCLLHPALVGVSLPLAPSNFGFCLLFFQLLSGQWGLP